MPHPSSRTFLRLRWDSHRSIRLQLSEEPSRVTESPWIEARPTEKPGTVVYKRRVKKGGFKSDDRVLSRVTFELPLFHALESKIHGLGGSTARYFGGLWIVALPLDCDLDLAAELRKISSMPTWKFRFYRARYSLRRLIRKILGATTEDRDAKSGGFTCTTSLANKKSDSE